MKRTVSMKGALSGSMMVFRSAPVAHSLGLLWLKNWLLLGIVACHFELLGFPGRPQKCVAQWPFGLVLEALGHYFTYFWGPGRDSSSPTRTPPPKTPDNSNWSLVWSLCMASGSIGLHEQVLDVNLDLQPVAL